MFALHHEERESRVIVYANLHDPKDTASITFDCIGEGWKFVPNLSLCVRKLSWAKRTVCSFEICCFFCCFFIIGHWNLYFLILCSHFFRLLQLSVWAGRAKLRVPLRCFLSLSEGVASRLTKYLLTYTWEYVKRAIILQKHSWHYTTQLLF